MSCSSNHHSLSSTFSSGLIISVFICYEIHDAGLLDLKKAFQAVVPDTNTQSPATTARE
jgi:hypothetical protein